MSLIISLCLLGKPLSANAPQTSIGENYVNYNDLFLETTNIPITPHTLVLGDITATNYDFFGLVEVKYPELADLLYCICENESGFNPEAIGDNGLAFGWFQIHYIENGITLDCAKDLECSMDWTVSEIKKGNDWKWTTYESCLAKTS
jgi:hypothetical protein